MKIVLLSGGAGERLWPLSNEARAKQFLKVLEPRPNGDGQRVSMLQRIWGQLASAGLTSGAYIAAGESQEEAIRGQLGEDVRLILEPARRDTMPAIALAAAYLRDVEGVAPDETIAVVPVDQVVDDDFFERLAGLASALPASGGSVGLLGVMPSEPSEKFGYILPSETSAHEMETGKPARVARFVEKPSRAEAEALIAAGALWNCGVFAFQLDYILRKMRRRGWPVEYIGLKALYIELERISFDYAIVQGEQRVIVQPYTGGWKDLGTWDSLSAYMAARISGRGILHEACSNTHIINELDIPVAAIGLTNVVIAASADGILISDKASSPRLKELSAAIKGMNGRPMQEERGYGTVRILDCISRADGTETITKRIRITAGKSISYHEHARRKEVWTLLDGHAQVCIEDVVSLCGPGDVVSIPQGTRHGIMAQTDCELIEVQIGRGVDDADMIRYEYSPWTGGVTS